MKLDTELKTEIVDAITQKPWFAAKRLKELLERAEVIEEAQSPSEATVAPQTRTVDQNAAIHLWFRQIADICQNQGVTMNLIINHTHDVAVTEHGVKALWHVLQKALFGSESTTEIRKVGQIDVMIDHFVSLFAKEEVELPPFPHDPKKKQKPDYPTYDGPPTI